jgi:pyruvate dehydrogenase E2 component (dihydrolipoamide acetyltransferase)
MAFSVIVPRLGWTMEEGVFVEWLKHEGEPVRAGEMLFVLESEKAAQEIEALEGGVLRIHPDAPRPGTTVAVGTVLGCLVAPGEPAPWEVSGAAAPLAPNAEPAASPPPAPVRTAARSAVVRPADGRSRPAISPRARRLAAELGVDWSALTGSGRTGRIRERDIRTAAAAAPRPTSPRILPLTPMRKTIAERMVAGARATAPVTLTTKVDATNLVNLRDQFEEASSAEDALVPSYTDLMIKLAAEALRQHPQVNACWSDEGIVLSEAVHVAIAVDTEAGLLAPVLRDVQALTLRQVAAGARALIEQARARRLAPEQLQGGTFTITNLGMHGIDAFTPILNLPQCAILGMGRIVREPACRGRRIVPRARMVLSMTFDHRALDGGPAARFLDALRRHAEQPAPWLMP